jgi:CHAT domain-containing protein
MIAEYRKLITGEMEGIGKRDAEAESFDLRQVSLRSDRDSLRTAITTATRHLIPVSISDSRVERIKLGTALRKALFDPLIPALTGRSRLFLAPDGDLARLPLEVLPVEDGRYLIDDYQISYLSVGRDILRFREAATGQPTDPLVVVDPDFDLTSSEGPSSISGSPFPRLTGALKEGEAIGTLLDQEHVSGSEALESTIKGCLSPHILHIATHGFFFPNASRDPNEVEPAWIAIGGWEESRLTRLAQVQNPLLRSALALAGANTWLQRKPLPPEAEDGILTAEDVSGLDLLATELVVLSACDTGLGEVQVGEGVFGLRRAFVLAGAKTLVMSLWKVPDQQTQELMVDFYQHILKGQPRAGALRQAQLAIKAKYPDPLYWGAFICQGDPGPLQWITPSNQIP